MPHDLTSLVKYLCPPNNPQLYKGLTASFQGIPGTGEPAKWCHRNAPHSPQALGDRRVIGLTSPRNNCKEKDMRSISTDCKV